MSGRELRRKIPGFSEAKGALDPTSPLSGRLSIPTRTIQASVRLILYFLQPTEVNFTELADLINLCNLIPVRKLLTFDAVSLMLLNSGTRCAASYPLKR